MEIIFRNPFYLWVLLLVPAVILAHYFSLKYSKGRAIKFANFVALARVSERVRVTSNLPVLLIRILVFIAIVFALAGTTLHYTGSQIDADYIIAIDASASMLANDFTPTRFDSAKDSAIQFIDQLPTYTSVGIMSFSGITYVHQPLTTDKNLAKNAVLDQNILATGGTSIGDTIITGTNLLINSGKSKVIIIMTDGRSNLGVAIDNAIDYANNHNVIVYTIGIGTEEGYYVDIEVASGPLGVDLEELNLIAESTGGTSYHPATRTELLQAYEDIAKGEKTKASIDLTFFLLLFVLAALLAEWILTNTRYKIIP